MKPVSRTLSALLGCMAVMLGAPAQADDSEVFTNASFLATGVRPNVLFIIDTSGSMTEKVNVWDPKKGYSGACPSGRIYWRAESSGSKVPPDCSSNQWISVDNNRCAYAWANYNKKGTLTGGLSLNGWWNGRTLMLVKKDKDDKDLNPTKWASPVAGRDWKIECFSDRGIHGDDKATDAPNQANKYPRNGTTGTTDSTRWGNDKANQQVPDSDWNNNYVSLFTSDYINWYNSLEEGVVKTRFEIVRDVALDMVDTLQGVNLGLMRYSYNAQGGMVTYPVSTLTDAARDAMSSQLENDFQPDGYTPLSETFFEAYRYLAGGDVKYGNSSTTTGGTSFKSVAASRVGNDINAKKYDSPMDFSCQTTTIVYLTDGLPTEDVDATTSIDALPGTTCAAGVNPKDVNDKNGRCMEALAKYLHDTDLRTDVTGNQNVTTYMIGFGEDVAESKDFLDKVAAAGGSGQAYTQNDAAGLKSTLEKIISEVQESADTTFVAPAVSVNAFNRSQNLNELYVSVFAPSKNLHWPGNLKKYRIVNGELYGASVAAKAVDPATGYFAKGTQAMNTVGSTPDGPNTKLGGAAATLEDTTTTPRKIYTYLDTNKDLTAAVNAFTDGNTALTTTMLNALDAADRTRIIQYTRGLDLNDEDKASDFHHRMGDPMHARPAILIHGGTVDAPDGTVFMPTNDGVLHAFDMAHITEPDDPMTNITPKATKERWAFIPSQFLTRQNSLFKDAPTANRRYALDGDAKVLKFDKDQNGIINSGDAAYLYFCMGRGGTACYALDVTTIDKPKFMWMIDSTTSGFATLGRTWSTPQLGRVKIGDGSGQNKQLFVLVFGGGYDTRNDNAPLDPKDFVYGEDSVGNSLFIVDAVSGKLLWRAGKTGSGANFTSDRMTHSFPAALTTLDTDQDRFIDRIYASDVDGKVWRFDLTNGESADKLAVGGVLASVGNGALPAGSRNAANARRFYNSPDVASMAVRGARPFFNIAIGSGYRGHPLNKDTQDRFYSIRDYDPYNTRTQDSYTEDAIVTDAELIDVTDMTKKVTDQNPGWKINLNTPDWRGEKNLGDATTAAGVILFTSFTPLGADPNDPCMSRSLNRVWAVYATNGDPFTHWVDGETGKLDASDRYADLTQKGIAPSVQVLANPEGGTVGVCGVGQVMLKRCVDFGSAIHSYWEHK
jgi:type IV pilus assembly protein PilY1